MNYSDEIIQFAFRHERPDVANPGSERLAKFDTDLFKTFDPAIVKELTAKSQDTDKRTRSRVLLLALMSPGDDVGPKVRNAVKYFINVAG